MAGKFLNLTMHFIWSTKDRAPLIRAELRDRLYGYIGGVLEKNGAKLLCAGGVADHIHLLVSLPSTMTISDAVSVIKVNSSRWIHETWPELKGFAWQSGYGAFSVSKSNEEVVRQYIRNQEAHHQRRDFKEEFLDFLKKHRIDYDERYIWE